MPLDGAQLVELVEAVMGGVVHVGGWETPTPVVLVSNSMARQTLLTARGGDEVVWHEGVSVASVLPDRGDRDLIDELRRTHLTGLSRRAVQVWRDSDGSARTTLDYVMTRLSDGSVLWSFRDESEVARTAVSATAAVHDVLTGLPNRQLLRQRMFEAQRLRLLTGRQFAVVFVDLDGLRTVNNSFGHVVGDELLRAAGIRLASMVRDADTVARLGGDEFVMLIEGMQRPDEVAAFYNRMRDSLAAPLTVAGVSVRMAASIGVVLDPDPHADPDDVLHNADAAMYEAKEAGGGRAVVYDEAQRPSLMGRLVTAGELVQASTRDEFLLHYQPVVDLLTGQEAGCEALLRWQHPSRGLLAPAAFMEAAEASDEIMVMSEWAFNEAVRQVAVWESEFDLDYYRIGVNFAPRQFTSTNVVAMVEATLARHGVEGSRMVVEITESDVLDSRSASARQIVALRDLGLRVAVDDFGGGHNSMSWLRDLPVDMIKVDRTLVSLDPTQREEDILAAIVGIGRAIGADVVMEGIERVRQVEVARRCGVRFGQGYLLGRGAAAADDALPLSLPGALPPSVEPFPADGEAPDHPFG